MPNILDTIVAHKHLEVAAARQARPLSDIMAACRDAAPTRSLRQSILSTPGGIIAEFKRASPSLGAIHPDARPEAIVPTYEAAGAAAVSILTDQLFFGGSTDDIVAARPLTGLPILRKEFVIDEYQIYEARAIGADAILLIAAVLGAERCHTLAAVAHEAGLEVLLEVHEADELAAFGPDVDVVGVNNRDLRVFRTDPARSSALRSLLPAGTVCISESGLLDPLVSRRLAGEGFNGFLIGEAFMKTPQPGEALRQYLATMLQA